LLTQLRGGVTTPGSSRSALSKILLVQPGGGIVQRTFAVLATNASRRGAFAIERPKALFERGLAQVARNGTRLHCITVRRNEDKTVAAQLCAKAVGPGHFVYLCPASCRSEIVAALTPGEAHEALQPGDAFYFDRSTGLGQRGYCGNTRLPVAFAVSDRLQGVIRFELHAQPVQGQLRKAW
jgi:hypothetical protein